MAIDWNKKNTASQKADDVKKRLKDSMDNKKPGYKPPATAKVKPIKNGAKLTFKF